MTADGTPANKRRPLVGWLLALAGLAAVALQPLLSGFMPWRGDGLLHFVRLTQLARAVGAGTLWPRWAPDLGFGFGFPLFHYYAPLSYYLALPALWLGASAAAATRLVYGAALIALALLLFFWTRRLAAPLGRQANAAGLIAAAAGLYAPYLLANVYHRAALAEVWGLVFLTAALAAATRLAQQPNRPGWLALTGAYAALLLTHNILALLGTPLLLAWGAGLWWIGATPQAPSPRRLRRHGEEFGGGVLLITALVAGLLLTAFFWLPAFVEKDLVQIDRLTASSNFAYANNFHSLADLLAWPAAADPLRVNPPLPLSLGWPALLLATAGLLFPTQGQGESGVRRQQMVLGLGVLGLVLMTLSLSKPIWDVLPLLAFVQFPWRFIGPATLLLAPLAGLGAARLLLQLPRPRLLTGLTLLALLLYGLPWLFPAFAPPPADPLPADVIRFEQASGALGATSAGDYLPTTVETLPAPDALLPRYDAAGTAPIPRLAPPPGITLAQADYGLLSADLELQAAGETTLTFDWFYLPGWQARLDGKPIPVEPAGPHGLLTVEVPAGSHQLTIAYRGTPLQQGASWLSLLALLGVAGALFLPRLWAQEKRQEAAALPSIPLPTGLALLAAGLLLLGVKSLWLDGADTPFRSSRLAGQMVSDAAPAGPINFGNQLTLLGSDLPSTPLPADDAAAITLFWQAQPPVNVEYSVSLRLLDDMGRLYGQSDNMHPAGIPVPRWQAGEYAHDAHLVTPLHGTPPGTYAVQVTVYPTAGGAPLETLSPEGRPTGLATTVGTLTVAPPETPVDPARLPLTVTANAPASANLLLLGWDPPAPTVDVGQPLALLLYWGASGPPAADYRAELLLRDAAGQIVTAAGRPPGIPTFPTSRWTAGTVVRDEWQLFVPAVARDGTPVANGDYRLSVRLLRPDGSPPGAAIDLATVTVTAPERSLAPPAPEIPLEATLGDVAALVGYGLQPAAAGETARLTLYWQALAPTNTAYVVFVQLLNDEGRIIVQRDSPPLAGSRPTTSWLPGEYLTDSYHLPLPADLPPGPLRLIVGLYDPATGARLPTATGDSVQLDAPLTAP